MITSYRDYLNEMNANRVSPVQRRRLESTWEMLVTDESLTADQRLEGMAKALDYAQKLLDAAPGPDVSMYDDGSSPYVTKDGKPLTDNAGKPVPSTMWQMKTAQEGEARKQSDQEIQVQREARMKDAEARRKEESAARADMAKQRIDMVKEQQEAVRGFTERRLKILEEQEAREAQESKDKPQTEAQKMAVKKRREAVSRLSRQFSTGLTIGGNRLQDINNDIGKLEREAQRQISINNGDDSTAAHLYQQITALDQQQKDIRDKMNRIALLLNKVDGLPEDDDDALAAALAEANLYVAAIAGGQ
jgi:hypothetical protein